MSTGFNSTNNEIATVRQLLENHELLFEVTCVAKYSKH